jgi:hypothetical protein
MSRAVLVLAAAALGAVAVAGCGFGPGEAAEGRADLTVTREFGRVPMVTATLEGPTESDTVIRMLDANADIETSYGDNFVDSIDGFSGSAAGGGSEDWFFFVNGYYSDVGAGETRVRPGDRIWWDYRYWSAAYRVPAVVGSWPEPFLRGKGGEAPGTVVQCLTDSDPCATVIAALADAGVRADLAEVRSPEPRPDELRILVGPWDAVRADPAARQIERGPATSGVYATFADCDGAIALTIDDDHGRPVERLDGAGLIAAVRENEDEPTWVVTGTDDDATAGAAAAVGADTLRDRYAVAVDGGEAAAIPAEGGAAPVGECR